MTTPTPTPSPEATTIESAVASAVEQVASPQVEETTPTETTPTETQPATPKEPEGPSQEEINNALNVYGLLRDPATARQALEYIAKSQGLQIGDLAPQPKSEPAKAPSLQQILEQNLGDYKFLAPALAPALEQYLAPIQQNIQRTQFENMVDRAISSLDRKTSGEFSKHQAEIAQLMDVVQPAANVPYEKYLETLYNMATGQKVAPSISRAVTQKVVNRINQNVKEALPSPSAATEPRIEKGPKLPTIAEAVAAAVRGTRFSNE